MHPHFHWLNSFVTDLSELHWQLFSTGHCAWFYKREAWELFSIGHCTNFGHESVIFFGRETVQSVKVGWHGEFRLKGLQIYRSIYLSYSPANKQIDPFRRCTKNEILVYDQKSIINFIVNYSICKFRLWLYSAWRLLLSAAPLIRSTPGATSTSLPQSVTSSGKLSTPKFVAAFLSRFVSTHLTSFVSCWILVIRKAYLWPLGRYNNKRRLLNDFF